MLHKDRITNPGEQPSMKHFEQSYPFPAIVGQDTMKLALVLNAISPGIGGVLIRGEKGTAKSTAVRALAELLPERRVVTGCRFSCNPDDQKEMCETCRKNAGNLGAVPSRMRVVELPVSATEDKVVGTLDIGHALKTGEKRFEPGILAEAHRNILYVDEVNLLNDHIVDVLLDVAAMGVNVIEREGVSYSHPSSFILIGTMNPEEGELRPQLLDRFGLCVQIEGIRDPETRLDVIRRRMAYEKDPAAFIREWEAREKGLQETIVKARALLPDVKVPDPLPGMIVRICIDMEVDGHRADIAMMKTASAIAAFAGRSIVEEDDIRSAAALVLPHRMRRQPFSGQQMDPEKLDESIQKSRAGEEERDRKHQPDQPPPSPEEDRIPDASMATIFSAGDPFAIDQSSIRTIRRPDARHRTGSGRRSTTESDDGRYVRSRVPSRPGPDIAIDATVRAAASHQHSRTGNLAITIEPPDIREKVRERRTSNTVLFIVDASGSMGVQKRMAAVKGAILSLLVDAYQKRDRVGMISFRNTGAELLLPPTGSVELAKKHLLSLPTGGKTPLGSGLSMGLDVIGRERMIRSGTIPLLILISDGKANVSTGSGQPFEEALVTAGQIREAGIHSLVIDPEPGFLRLGMAEAISGAMGAKYLHLDELKADTITGAIRGIGM